MKRAVRDRAERLSVERLVEGYLNAFEHVVASGFGHEIDWQERCAVGEVTESGFIREAAWVILSSGMRESVIGHRFTKISTAFLDWASAGAIVHDRRGCIRRGLRCFNHRQKLEAIADVADHISSVTFDEIRSVLREGDLHALEVLPYIGPVTVFHLAKNLGMNVAKPDRHLQRLCESVGATDATELCSIIAEATGDRIGTVDIVLWRYATIQKDYRLLFQPML